MSSPKELIIQLLRDKSKMKQDVYGNAQERFNELKQVLKAFIEEMKNTVEEEDKRITFHFRDKGPLEAEVKIAGDILIFYLHTNVFQFDKTNSLWKTTYLQEDENRGYACAIHVYNFLSDSIKYHRSHDKGYLIARLFLNKENHFMVQGKRQLGFLYNDFINAQLDKEAMGKFVESAVLYTLDFDLYMPPYDNVKVVSLEQINALTSSLSLTTGKRLGFKFGYEEPRI